MNLDQELSRARLVPIPERMKKLPVCPTRGVPVPWFAEWSDGKPEFRVADYRKILQAITDKACWVCGQRLIPPSVFVLGPMCGLNRISSEPPSHPECAEYSVKACPFLSRPRMERREGGIPEEAGCAGHMIRRNPGVCALWVTKGFRLLREPGGYLFDVGDCHSVTWWSQGRPATRSEVLTSIITGIPHLKVPDDPETWEYLARAWVALDALLPKE